MRSVHIFIIVVAWIGGLAALALATLFAVGPALGLDGFKNLSAWEALTFCVGFLCAAYFLGEVADLATSYAEDC